MDAVERIRAQYGDRVTFIVLYQREAHAGQVRPGVMDFSHIQQPLIYAQRCVLADSTHQQLGVNTTLVIDDMRNTVRRAYGGRPNSAFIIDRSGKVVHKELWAQPADWPRVLERLLREKGS